MNKKIKIGLFVLIILGTITLCLTYKSNDKIIKTKKRKQNNLAIMIKEDGATDYTKSNSKDIPKGDYVLNRDKSYCKNNGKIGNYDSSLGKVSFSFIGTDSCFLYFDYYFEPKGYEKILLDNGNGATTVDEAKAYIEGRTTSTTPDFSTVATTNEGMYAKEDDYTATTGMKSYYFRGAVNNNWVKFGKDSSGNPIYWRIIRINGDGSIRMIYSGTTKPDSSSAIVMTGTGTQITVDNTNTFKFNSIFNKAEYVGYQYIEGQQHGFGKCDGTNNASCTVNGSTVYNSAIKQAIDKWYTGTTLKDNDLIADQIFCNDRSASSTQTAAWTSTGASYSYGARGRLDSNKKPILTCPTASDKFTVNTSNGNGALTYPVGLITADEVAMAGELYGSSNENSSYYLYTNQDYWSGSPYIFESYGIAFSFFVHSSGLLGARDLGSSHGARPVVSLSSKAKLSGSGTYNDVYTVVGDNSTEDTSSGKSFDTVFAANDTDIFSENGLRYEGKDPKNYICLDNKTGGACSDSSLLFRIIGLFDEEYSSDGTTSAGTKKLLKILDTNNYGGTSGKYWNSGGTNNWSTASLKTELYGTYLTTLLRTSSVNSKLSSAITNAKWHLGGASDSNYQTLTTEGIYREERNPSAIYSGNPSSIYAKIGLMYPSDYGYATVGGSTTSKANCRAKELYNWDSSSFVDCKNNDWVFKSATFIGNGEWFISPGSSSSYSASHLNSAGYVNLNYSVLGNPQFAVRPTFYLDSSILKIVGTGDGSSSNPYRVG